jgi:deoxyribodipyrimidine photo-lyase
MKKKLVVIWHRSDLRLLDNPALYYGIQYANEHGLEVLPLFILDPFFISNAVCARRSRFLVRLLSEFKKNFPEFCYTLGSPKEVFKTLLVDYELVVFANADYEPYSRIRDLEITKFLTQEGSSLKLFEDRLSIDKQVRTKTSKNLYSVFTPFKNQVLNHFIESKVLDRPPTFKSIKSLNQSLQVLESDILGKIPALSIEVLGQSIDLSKQDSELKGYEYISEIEVLKKFEVFLENGYFSYGVLRDQLAVDGTSKMSVALKWGLVSSRTLKEMILVKDPFAKDSTFISELVWREFYRYLLYHYPKLLEKEFLPKYQSQAIWVSSKMQLERFKAFIEGKTGYQVVDASVHQLRTAGWMHNRARMVAGSVLCKNLGVSWLLGQEYFRAMLLDLDEASNCGGWQWSASVGADPKPIRIFNPYLQEEKFDKDGVYRKKYLPSDYACLPIIEHSLARDEALHRYKSGQKGLLDS